MITDANIQTLMNAHCIRNATMTALLYDSSNLESGNERPKETGEPGVFIGMDDKNSRLLLALPKGDHDELDIRTSIVRKFPRIHLYSQLKDSHFYIFRKWVADLVIKNKNISSVRSDLIPLLLNFQHRPDILKREGVDKLLQGQSDLLQEARSMSTSGHQDANIVFCGAMIYNEGLTSRLQTLWNYAEMNRCVVKTLPDHQKISAHSNIDAKTQVS